ncbi:holo-ACP synthase [Enterovibrio nigricans]|uniref:Holo-[acyl-carrier-protein] synthase n=1 Tax=Enterovibrio nigricans DSM 22720 TaxID=1121868 RepID=A0A1T4TZL2_9GAMM|nr:holo-ACP synthase [Enterovibrio nigricans]PKF51658.1 holo-ACP synthase [Enterovibrio nigricans]SKA45699.1 holo-[acyl-carrier protein] synthase [Enterovibrio nigricans DSM 22720]
MAVVGLGTDIAEIGRFDTIIARKTGDAFAQRVLTPSELEKYASTKQKARYLAKRFAAKEAASKALGTGIACGVTFHDFDVTNDEHGKPLLALSGVAKQLADARGVTNILLTIADEKRYAVATVLLEQ